MPETIVTHYNPDPDAIASIWLILRFWSLAEQDDWRKAGLEFVAAGKTFRDEPVDINPEVIHVDTGGGKFDHHQDRLREPACVQVYKEIKRQSPKLGEDQALQRLIAVVADADLGNYIHWPESKSDHYEFSFDSLISGLRKVGYSDRRVVELGMTLLDVIHQTLKNKVRAEQILKNGTVFKTKWGKGIGFETENDTVLDLGEKQGFSVVVRKDPRNGSVRIYARNDRNVDLTSTWERLKEKDPEATWFLHQSKCLLLNGSSKNPEMKITKLGLGEVVEILKRND